MGKVPLDRALSKLGILSRSRAKSAILAGEIKINEKIVKDPNYQVVPEEIAVKYLDKSCNRPKSLTILFHKPKGYVTTAADEKGRKTIYDLLSELKDYHLIPVGRLDMHTSGLLILTNDTQFANFLTDPINKIPRTYIATVRGEFTKNKMQQLQHGITENGEQLHADKIEIIKASGKESILKVTLLEGKNREIRRMFLSLGHEVIKLKRVSFGDFTLGDLEPASWVEVPESKCRPVKS